MASSDSVATVALVISIIALIVTSAQLLSQIFATAEGHRRCQPSVIGSWATLTRRRWRWSSFRFETIVTTPEIVLRPFHIKKASPYLLEPHDQSTSFEELIDNSFEGSGEELVCWIHLLNQIKRGVESDRRAVFLRDGVYHQSAAIDDHRGTHTIPCILLKKRSWDFMPPEVVRPFASTTVTDIAILALRMGMSWRIFKPEEGQMEAEGNGHVLSSTLIRALGTLLRYVRDEGAPFYKIKSYLRPPGHRSSAGGLLVETDQADKMWFGILPGNTSVLGRDGNLDFPIGDLESIYAILDKMDPSGEASGALKETAPSLYGFTDIIPMLAPWMRQSGTMVNILPRVTSDVRGSTTESPAHHLFRSRLEMRARVARDSSPLIESVRQEWETLNEDYADEWQGENGSFKSERYILAFLDVLEAKYDWTTDYFVQIMAKTPGPFYHELVKVHLTRAASVRKRIPADRLANQSPSKPSWVVDSMGLYWDDIEYYQLEMSERGYTDHALVADAWIMLMFRAFLWSRAHDFDSRVGTLPSRYLYSQLPVYIG
ncbi:MAG: hypothetical protein Q9163_004105 [Psora crenata]